MPHHRSLRWATSPLAFGVTLALATITAAAQQPLYSANGPISGVKLGSSVAMLGDVDGDNLADVAVGAPDNGPGLVQILSGKTGAVIRTFNGDDAGDQFGAAVASAGDVDGDGVADLIIGAPGDDNNGLNSGMARVVSGGGAVLYSFDGDAAGDAFGSAVSGGGDSDDDGYDDFIVGAPGDDSNGLTDSGSARAFSGKTGAVLFDFDGAAAQDAFGSAVAGGFDADGDCAADFAVGAPNDDTGGNNAGSAQVLSGATGLQLFTVPGAAAGDALGTSVARAGDADGDGNGDIVAGAPGTNNDTGAALIVSGASGATLHTLHGQGTGDRFGTAVAGGGDVDGDGNGDVMVGAPGVARNGVAAGAAQVYSGKTGVPLRSFHGAAAGDDFGRAVGAADDLNGDGYADVLAGAPGEDSGGTDAGALYAFAERPPAAIQEAAYFSTGGIGARFGFAIETVGDIDKDGVQDYLIGAPFEGALQEGAVRLFSGATHSFVKKFTGPLTGLQTGTTWFGHELDTVGDIDQDTYPDFAIGAWHHDSTTGVVDAGRCEIISGQTLTTLVVLEGTGFSAHMGSSIGTLGDVDGDQVDDFFVGQLLLDNQKGELSIYSGVTRAPIPGLSFKGLNDGDLLSSAADSIGDIDGDGVTDIAIGASQAAAQPEAPGYVQVRSGRTGTLIYTFTGLGGRSFYGNRVANTGDVNADGVTDLIIGAWQTDVTQPSLITDAGMVDVRSGADGSLIYRFFGTTASQGLGSRVAGAGDVNGDGYADFIIGSPGAIVGVPLVGQVNVHSGFDGSVLHSFSGAGIGYKLQSGNGLGDINGDGLGDFAISSHEILTPGRAGEAWIYTSTLGSDPGAFQTFGAACANSSGGLPHVGMTGRPLVGQTFTATLRTVPAGSLALMNLGAAPTALSLTALGAPGCTLLTLPVISVLAAANSGGKAGVGVPIPNLPALTGAVVYVQWAIVDLPANLLSVIVSDAARVTVGT